LEQGLIVGTPGEADAGEAPRTEIAGTAIPMPPIRVRRNERLLVGLATFLAGSSSE